MQLCGDCVPRFDKCGENRCGDTTNDEMHQFVTPATYGQQGGRGVDWGGALKQRQQRRHQTPGTIETARDFMTLFARLRARQAIGKCAVQSMRECYGPIHFQPAVCASFVRPNNASAERVSRQRDCGGFN